MTRTFTCGHCGEEVLGNIRLKGKQKYCGKKSCQQARKNAFERKRLKSSSYRKSRLSQKSKWRKNKPADQYQKEYRRHHPDYEKTNRQQQEARNKGREKARPLTEPEKIVKTDALPLDGLLSKGLYVIKPYPGGDPGMIVKTDTLIIEIQSYRPKGEASLSNSP